jgi:polyferredoxin
MVADMTLWRGLADLVLVTHAGYVLFVVGGQALIVIGWIRGWEWTRCRAFRLLHLVAIGLVMLEAWLGINCPLTILENFLRLLTGAAAYENSFIGHWLQWVIFYAAPEWIFPLIYTIFTALVILTWLAYPPRRKLK